MKKNVNYFEVIIGTIVLLCASLFLYTSMKSAKVRAPSGYHLKAKFDNASGIENGSDVTISGVKVGVVKDYSIDASDYRAVVTLSVQDNIKLPVDSSIKITSAGLLGSKYLAISPGSDEEILADSDEILFTQSSISLEELLGKFLFSADSGNK